MLVVRGRQEKQATAGTTVPTFKAKGSWPRPALLLTKPPEVKWPVLSGADVRAAKRKRPALVASCRTSVTHNRSFAAFVRVLVSGHSFTSPRD